MGNLFADVRYAVRLLIRKPGFAAVAILTLALGIGATTAIFTVVHAVLLRPLSFPEADRLVEVRIVGRDAAVFPLPDTDFLVWRSQNDTAEAVAVYDTSSATITGDGPPERVISSAVTDRFFDVLGVQPLLGRAFHEGDDLSRRAKDHGAQSRTVDASLPRRSGHCGALHHVIRRAARRHRRDAAGVRLSAGQERAVA